MNISYNWLKEYVDFDLTPDEVAAALTSIGLETGSVEEVQTVKGGLEGLVIGEVLTCEPHPNSDHMHITTVNLGQGEPVQIVCGAANVAAGQKVVVATLGTKLYDGDECFTIKKSKLRGVESNGMICAEDEIGIGTDHAGIIVLPETAVPGTLAKDYYNIKSDYVLEVDITPNRADACSHYGVARDLYAYLVQNGKPAALKKPSVEAFAVDNHDLDIRVTVENSEACPHYAGVTVKGVTVKESPEWLQNKLRIIGLRPINNVVDITNYIVHAFGQPLHCFDADRIKGGEVIVKTLPEGTPFTTLDGVERKLNGRDLMICNREEPMCIAGVFGGLDSGSTETTKDVFLESAYFHPTWVRKTARRHGLNTDASFRFERGVDPNATLYCLKLAALMVKELAGGTISSDIKDVCAAPARDFRVELSYGKVHALIGKEIPAETIKSIVTSLEMKIVGETEEGLTLDVPPYRVDVQRDCDVIEDILRIYGYNNVEIPTALKSSLTTKGECDKSNRLQNLVAEQLVGCGFNEILNNSLTRAAYYDGLESYPAKNLVMLMNPLSADLNAMRQTLLFGGLESIAHNANRKNADLKFFEFGNCYYFNEEKRNPEKALAPYSEDYHLGLWITGKRVSNSWAHQDEDSSVYELKAYVENIFARLGLQMHDLVVGNLTDDIYAAALSVQTRGGKRLATFGVVTRKLLKAFDIDNEVYYADLNWKELMKAIRNVKVNYTEISKFPAVKRDLALLIDKKVQFAEIEKIAYETEKKLLKEVSLFDVYEGKNLEAGKKSYAVSFLLQDENATLNDKQIDKVMQKLIARIEYTIRAIKEAQAEKEKTRQIRQELNDFRESLDTLTAKEQEEKIARKIEKLKEKQNRKKEKKANKNQENTLSAQALAEQQAKKEAERLAAIVPGSYVKIKGQTSVGEVLEINGKKAIVAFGSIKTTVKLDRLERTNAQPKQADVSTKSTYISSQTQDSMYEKKLNFKQDIDVRGMRGDEALQAVTYFIDDAILVGMSRVRILHGTGTGILRTLIRQYLQTVPGVSHFADEHIQFGGAGITVVDLS